MIQPANAVFAPTERISLLIGLMRLRLLRHRTIEEVNAIHRQVLGLLVPDGARCGLRILRQRHVRPVLAALEPYILDDGDPVDEMPVRGRSSLMQVQHISHHPDREIFAHRSSLQFDDEENP